MPHDQYSSGRTSPGACGWRPLCYDSAVKKRPFLAREALYWLTLLAPAITLLVANIDGKPALDRVASCLLSTWICTIVCGVSVHFLVNAMAPRLIARTSTPVTVLALGATVAALVTAEMLELLPRLVWLDANLSKPPAPFVMQALVVAAFYVLGARLATWLGDRAQEAKERAAESEQRTLRARLAALQAQVNPHFLFNTLNAIASLIPKDPTSAESTVERLASVLQYSIASSARGRVTLAEELAAVRDYLEIRAGALWSAPAVEHRRRPEPRGRCYSADAVAAARRERGAPRSLESRRGRGGQRSGAC